MYNNYIHQLVYKRSENRKPETFRPVAVRPFLLPTESTDFGGPASTSENQKVLASGRQKNSSNPPQDLLVAGRKDTSLSA